LQAQAARTVLAQSAVPGGKIDYGKVGGYNPTTSRSAAPVQSGPEQTHIPEGESFAEYLARRGIEQAVSSTVAPTTGRPAVTYGRDGYDPKNRASLESSYTAAPATSGGEVAFVAAPVPVGAGRSYKVGEGYSPQSRRSSSSSVEAPAEARPRSTVSYGTPAYDPKNRGALERAYSAPAAPHLVSDATVTVTSRTVDTRKPYGGYDPKNRPSSENQGKLATIFAAAAKFVNTISSIEPAPQLSATLGSKIDYKMGSGYNPASRGAAPVVHASAPVTSYSPADSVAAAPAGRKIDYGKPGYTPTP
jgi:hypothetical protein